MAALIQQYDPNVVIQAADDKLAQDDLAGGQMIFQSKLLDWVDDAREQQQHQQIGGALGSTTDPEQMREAIATLWLAYAHFLIKAKQYKSATEAYEQAVQCPIAGGVGRVWLDYARFAEEREKVRTAQNIYLRALVGTTTTTATTTNTAGSNGDATATAAAAAVTDDQDRHLLWSEFLDMMRRHNDPNLTMEELQAAVESEHAVVAATPPNGMLKSEQQQQQPEPVMSNNIFAMASEPLEVPPSKRPKLGDTSPLMMMQQQQQQQIQQNTHVVTAEAVEMGKAELLEMTQLGSLPPEMMAVWMVRDGTDPAQPPEPPLFSASPPKLSDPSGKDLLGEEVALALIQRLMEKSGTVVLQACQGLWMLTAIKEQESKKSLEMLDQTMTTEMERLEANLEARYSVAGAAARAVEQMNERERAAFSQSCQHQRQQLLQKIAWEFRHLMWQQQQVFTKLKIPGFDGPTVDKSTLEQQASICSCLHSAFFLRHHVGQESHIKMLKSQEERLKKNILSSSSSATRSSNHGSRTPPANRSPMSRPANANTLSPHMQHSYNSFPSSHAPLQPLLLPPQTTSQQQQQQHATYMMPTQLQQQQQQQQPSMMAPLPYFNYMTASQPQHQQQQQHHHLMPGAPSLPPSFGQPPPQYYQT